MTTKEKQDVLKKHAWSEPHISTRGHGRDAGDAAWRQPLRRIGRVHLLPASGRHVERVHVAQLGAVEAADDVQGVARRRKAGPAPCLEHPERKGLIAAPCLEEAKREGLRTAVCWPLRCSQAMLPGVDM